MRPFPTRRRAGFALEATLAVLVLLVVLVASAATGAATMVRTSSVDQATVRLIFAADGAADQAMSQLSQLIRRTGIPSRAQLDSIRLPNYAGTTLDGVTISDVVRSARTPPTDPVRFGAFRDLTGEYARYDLDITARDRAQNTARAVVTIEAQLIPVFQFGVFFNHDLEVTPADSMHFAGRIHANGDIYLCGSGPIVFDDWITTPNRIIRDRKDASSAACGQSGTRRPMILGAGNTYRALGFDGRGTDNTNCCAHPAQDARFRDSSSARFQGRVRSGAFGLDSLTVPLPPGMDPYEVIQPRTGAEDPQVRLAKLAYAADWYLRVPYDSVPQVCAGIATRSTRRTFLQVPTPAQCAVIFAGHDSAFFDAREDRMVRTLDIDVANLRTWVRADSVRRTPLVLYIEFTGAPALQFPPDAQGRPTGPGGLAGGLPLPAIRLLNGHRLPNALTIVSHAPIYVQGDYNHDRTLTQPDTAWRPAALVGDAITFLSRAWRDSANSRALGNHHQVCLSTVVTGCSDNALAGADNSPMFVRAAIAAGHAPTTNTAADRGQANSAWFDAGGPTDYGGGLHNFPRFLEHWQAGTTVDLSGSLVSLFYSRMANWEWRQGSPVYGPPDRRWTFDARFRVPANLPPGTPKVGSVYRIAYRPGY